MGGVLTEWRYRAPPRTPLSPLLTTPLHTPPHPLPTYTATAATHKPPPPSLPLHHHHHCADLEELDVGVEEVALRHVDALRAELVHEAEDARRDRGLFVGLLGWC